MHLAPATDDYVKYSPVPRSIPALAGPRRVQYVLLSVAWAIVSVSFWHFWLSRPHDGAPALFWIMTACLFYETTVLPSVYPFFLGQMRTPAPAAAPSGLRVAMITLCVPSKESIEIIERQIRHMVEVTYPHDTWVLDEERDPRVADLCRRYGVHHFSRKGVAAWNQPHPPYQAKTKAGNVNAWLLSSGRAYEFFVQLDIDHHPRPDYLDRVLGYFRDPRVAWVQAPSVYGNLESWTARGSAEQELVLQGPLQMGFYGFSETPFIIGSHSTYRTSAMLEIGGMQPTRAEDHLDTVVLAQRDYVGVYVPEQIATGRGPETFDTYLAQQFAWAYSMIQVLFQYAPRYATRYRPRAALQFLFVQTWYASWSLSMLALFVAPSLLLVANRSIAAMSLGQFVLGYAPVAATGLGIWWWSRHWFHPKGLSLSWRGIVLHIARWPVVLWAFVNVVLRIRRPYMITPKGTERGAGRPFNVGAHGPYLLLVGLSLVAVWWFMLLYRQSAAQGYLLYAIQGASFMLLVFVVALVQDLSSLRREGLTRREALALRLRPLLVGAIAATLTGCTGVRALPLILEAATWSGPDLQGVAASSEGESVPGYARGVGLPLPTPAWEAGPGNAGEGPAWTAPRLPDASQLFVGAYDPRHRLLDGRFQAEMIYVDLSESSTARLGNQLASIGHAGRVPVVTLEPWPLTGQGYRSATLLADLSSGRYDAQLRALGAAVGGYRGQVVVRFAQEMDMGGLYPWGTDQPERYVEAYRHVHEVLQRDQGASLLWMWAPAGNANAAAYYPGDDVVDFVGITALSSEAFDPLTGTDRQQSFAQLMGEKYDGARAFGKPVVVAELGVSGPPATQAAWLQAMRSELGSYPALRGLIYYNDYNAVNALVPDPPNYGIDRAQWPDDVGAAGQEGACQPPLSALESPAAPDCGRR